MSSTAVIPRFLLPQRSAIWRTRISTANNPSALMLRHASNKPSNKKPSKPLVLEKPSKFTPPSHGARLRKEPPRYPGPALSAEEKARQATKKYPNMMPAEGTFLHWFINNRSIHMWICLGTLTSLALTVFITNFKRDSPYGDMLPHWSQLFLHPIAFVRSTIEIIRLDQAHMTVVTQERRKQKVEDVAKRASYRKAHGLDKDEGFGGWTAKSDAELQGPAIVLGDGSLPEQDAAVLEQHPPREKKPLKKWLGIW